MIFQGRENSLAKAREFSPVKNIQKGNTMTEKRTRTLPKGIRQRSNGKYEGRIKYDYQSYSVYGETITEVKRKMTELRYRLEHGTYVPKTKIKLNDWFQTWLNEYKKNRIKVGTYYSYEKYYKSMVKDRIGSKQLADIRGEHIQMLYNELAKEGYANSSIKIVSAVLNGCMEQALRNGLIERNPVKLAELPRCRERKERQALTKEQQYIFMKYAQKSYLYNFFSLLLRTGLRSGEIRGLKYTDIDRRMGVLHIRRTLKYIEGKGYFEDTPKTRSSSRDIPLTQDIIDILEKQRNYWHFEVEVFGRYLFCDENGSPLSRDRVQAEIDRIVAHMRNDGYEIGHITPHVFRHTFATRAIEAGMQPQVLKTILGHSSLAMTMDLYSHVLPDTKAEQMEKIAKAF